MDYRKEDSLRDRRKIPRFGEGVITDRRIKKEISEENYSETEKPVQSEKEFSDMNSMVVSLKEQILQELKKEILGDLDIPRKGAKGGRPSSIPAGENIDWQRKTYRFHKNTLRSLKQFQSSLKEHRDLSLLIDDALREFLGERGF
jgi:hypothetical protein